MTTAVELRHPHGDETPVHFSAGLSITAGEGVKLHVDTDEPKADVNLLFMSHFSLKSLWRCGPW